MEIDFNCISSYFYKIIKKYNNNLLIEKNLYKNKSTLNCLYDELICELIINKKKVYKIKLRKYNLIFIKNIDTSFPSLSFCDEFFNFVGVNLIYKIIRFLIKNKKIKNIKIPEKNGYGLLYNLSSMIIVDFLEKNFNYTIKYVFNIFNLIWEEFTFYFYYLI